MVVGLRPPPRATFRSGQTVIRRSHPCQLNDLREPVEDTLCPSGRACPACVKRLRTHRVRGAISWRGQALRFAPLPLCLSRRASDETDPAIPSALDGLKYSRLSRSSRFSTALRFGRHFHGRDRAPSLTVRPPASQTAGPSPQCLTVRRVRKRCVLAPCTEISYDLCMLLDTCCR